MNIYKKKRLDKLVKRLGMSQSLVGLLDSDKAYERFERAVGDCLQEYEDGSKKMRINVVNYQEVFSSSPTPWNSSKPKYVKVERAKSIPTRGIEYFKRNFGIGCEPETTFDIAEKEFGKFDTPDPPGYYIHKPRLKYCAKISYKISPVVKLLKQRHKKDIWYGTL